MLRVAVETMRLMVGVDIMSEIPKVAYLATSNLEEETMRKMEVNIL